MNQIRQSNVAVGRLVMISCAAVVAVRMAFSLVVGWDQSIQLETGYRFADGLGLTSMYCAAPRADLAAGPVPRPLTWYPPFFSLVVAGIVCAGLPIGVGLKIFYAIVTFAGWFAWGTLACHFLREGLGAKVLRLHWLVAAIMPIFFTPWWAGTDIILWAGVPYVVLLLFESTRSHALRFCAAAGVLAGALYAVRYASLFLLPAGIFMIFACREDVRSFMKRAAMYSFCWALALSPVAFYTSSQVSTTAGLPEYARFDGLLAGARAVLLTIGGSLWNCGEMLGVFFLKKAATFDGFTLKVAVGIFALLFAVILPTALTYSNRRRDPLGAALGMLVSSLVLFLFAASFLDRVYDYLACTRYLLPAGLSALFIYYRHAAVVRGGFRGMVALATAIVTLFVLYNGVVRPLRVFTGKAETLWGIILGGARSEKAVVGHRLISGNEGSLNFLKELRREHPEAVIYIQDYPNYVYNGDTGFRPIPPAAEWSGAFTDRPLDVYWVVNDPNCDGACRTAGTETAIPLSALPGVRTLKVFPAEYSKILLCELPAGFRFADNTKRRNS